MIRPLLRALSNSELYRTVRLAMGEMTRMPLTPFDAFRNFFIQVSDAQECRDNIQIIRNATIIDKYI
jgi:hypothetical protein